MNSTNAIFKQGAAWHAWIVSAAFVVPISLNSGSFNSKPIDITLSDVWLVIFSFIFLMKTALMQSSVKIASKNVIALAFIPLFYNFVISCVGAIFNSNPLSNIISAARFNKQFIFLILGWQIFFIYKKTIIKPFLLTCLLMQIILLASDLIWGKFPLGCGYESRWGGCFLNIEIYGFPNSSASYQVLVTGLMIAGLYELPSFKKFIIPIVVIGAVIAIFSISRAAWMYFMWIVFSGWIFLFNGRQKIFGIALMAFIGIIFSGHAFDFDVDVLIGVISKIERSLGDDPSSGRMFIWDDALKLIYVQPIFGYKFDHFSSYVSGFDTPHNQYLEIVFKSGLVGLLIYGLIIAIFWRLISHKKLNISKETRRFLKWGVLAGLLFNGLFQPIFSYTIVANLIMALIGYSLSAIECNSSCNEHETAPAKPR